jgi:hypothetical protein
LDDGRNATRFDPTVVLRSKPRRQAQRLPPFFIFNITKSEVGSEQSEAQQGRKVLRFTVLSTKLHNEIICVLIANSKFGQADLYRHRVQSKIKQCDK